MYMCELWLSFFRVGPSSACPCVQYEPDRSRMDSRIRPCSHFSHILRLLILGIDRYWGLAAVYSYKAYNDSNMLSVAQAIWNTSSPYQVQVSQLPTGRNPTRNVTLAAMCNNRDYHILLMHCA
jgi:hypothetical protein